MRSSNPRRLKLRPERNDQQHGKARDPVHRLAESLQARRVGPMHILEDHQYRPWSATAPPFAPLSASSVLLSALLRRQFKCRITTVVRQRQHVGKQRGVLRGG